MMGAFPILILIRETHVCNRIPLTGQCLDISVVLGIKGMLLSLTAADFEAMMNDGPEDYVSVLKRTQARLKEAMFSAGTPPGSLTGISKQLLALTREIERLEGNPAQGMTTQEDPEDDDDDGEFRPEAI